LPFLRLERATPTETEKTIEELKKQLEEKDKEIRSMKEAIVKIEPVIEFVNSFNQPQQLKEILDWLKDEFTTDPILRPLKAEFSPYIENKLNRIAKGKGITKQQALEQLVVEDLEQLEEADARFRDIEKARKPREKKQNR